MAEADKPSKREQEVPTTEPSGEGLKPDAHVERMRPDPARLDEQWMKLTGFLGRDTEAGFWRVYTTPSLDTYVRVDEADEADVVAHHADEATASDMGRTILYVRPDATLQYTAVTTARRQMQSEFLEPA
jgi:hypothetical protein